MDRGGELGGAGDYFGFAYHGYQLTHIDALSHVWGEDGMWGGRHGRDEVQPNGARWGGIEHWRDGIVTRGVLLDVPRHRGDPHVTADRPVQAAELEEIADAQGITLEPGDAVFVYSGREPFEASHPDWIPARDPHPGLASSCLRFLRENDVAVLGWDFMDAQPYEHGWAFIPHAAIQAFGVALLDNCSLEQAAAACSEAGRYEFMLSVAPLPMVGGTGSPVNPIAIFSRTVNPDAHNRGRERFAQMTDEVFTAITEGEADQLQSMLERQPELAGARNAAGPQRGRQPPP